VLRSDLATAYEATSPHFQLASTVAAWAEVVAGLVLRHRQRRRHPRSGGGRSHPPG
jgi:hypothetical protein